MRRPLLLPLRWHARPGLIVAGAAVTVLLLASEAGRPPALSHPALLVVQARGDEEAAAALMLLERRGDVAAVRRVPAAEIAARLSHAGMTLPPGALPLPPLIEARLDEVADPAPVAAALARVPGVTVDASPAVRPAPHVGRQWAAGLAAAALLVLAAVQEARGRAEAVRLLARLGATRGQALLPALVAAGLSVAAGAAIAIGTAAAMGLLPRGWGDVAAMGAAEVVLVAGLLAALLWRRA